ncbi:MAG: hypothetical protein NT003_02800 [Candidatus Magasanikbacteria bacterium]|nr:hypothetical protein [Candidatus Magasanikbacteria bacterium]
MKPKLVSTLSTMFVLAASMLTVATVHAKELEVRVNAEGNVEVGDRVKASSTEDFKKTTSTEKDSEEVHSTSTDKNENTTSTEEGDKGQFTSEEHRSSVANFVQSLLKVADREDGIGEEVRVIAQQQNDSSATSTAAMAKVESRGRIHTFILGTDFKSLGDLRSEMTTTQNHIDQLKKLESKMKTKVDKDELTKQISSLEDSQVKVNAFVTTHENKFSLFGWFVKLFSK